MFHKFAVSLFIVIAYANSLSAQQRVVVGSIAEGVSGAPLVRASVAIVRVADSSVVGGVLSNNQGAFALTLSDVAVVVLRASYAGLNPRIIDVQDIRHARRGDTIDVGRVLLEPRTLEEVVVESSRPMLEYQDGKKVFNVSENIGAAGGNALDVLRQIPTINVDMDGNISLVGQTGINVMIEEKPLAAYGNATQILKTLPAAAIQKVEIVVNPGAKYDAQGQAGAINIVLRRQQERGLNGIVDVAGGILNNYNGAALVNHRRDDFSVNAGADFFVANQLRFRSMETAFIGGDVLTRSGQSVNEAQSVAGRFGLDANLDSLQNISLQGEYRYNTFRNSDPWSNRFLGTMQEENETDQISSGPQTSLGITATHTLKLGSNKHELISKAFYFPDWFDVSTDLRTRSAGPEVAGLTTTSGRLSRTSGSGLYFEIMSDYSYPIGDDSKLEAGVDVTMQTINSRFDFSDLDVRSGLFRSNERLSNSALHYDDVYAAYVNYADKYGALSLSCGLRGEHTVNQFQNRQNSTLDFERAFGNLFPSIGLSYAISEAVSGQASYSRRIQRPTGPQLNPYVDQTDSLYWRSGNAMLLPEFTNSYQAGLLAYVGQSVVNVEGYYRQTTNAIQLRYREQIAPGVLLEKPYNFGESTYYGLSATANAVLASWIQINGEVSYYKQSSGGEFRGQQVLTEGDGWNSRIIVNSTLPLDVRSQVTFDYVAPQVMPQGRRREVSVLSLALSHEFKEQRLTVGLNWTDIFNTAQYGGSVFGNDFSTVLLNRRDYTLFSVNVSYRLNDYKGRSPRSAPSGLGASAA